MHITSTRQIGAIMRKKDLTKPNLLKRQTKPNYSILWTKASNQEPPHRPLWRNVWESPQNRPDPDQQKKVYVHTPTVTLKHECLTTAQQSPPRILVIHQCRGTTPGAYGRFTHSDTHWLADWPTDWPINIQYTPQNDSIQSSKQCTSLTSSHWHASTPLTISTGDHHTRRSKKRG